MSILHEIIEIENDKKLLKNFEEYKKTFWNKMVDIVARIAVEEDIAEYDIEFWKQQPCTVITLIYTLYKTKNKNN
jgi:hypothetical protein